MTNNIQNSLKSNYNSYSTIKSNNLVDSYNSDYKNIERISTKNQGPDSWQKPLFWNRFPLCTQMGISSVYTE